MENKTILTEPEAFENDIDNLSEPELAEWQKTGQFPKKAKESEETPAPKEKAAEVSEEEPESQTGTTRQERKPSESEKRIKELLGKVKELEDEVATTKAPKAEPKAERAKPTMQDKNADGTLKYPASDEGLEKYTDDMLDWKQEQRDTKAQADKAESEKKTREAKISEQRQKQEESWLARAKESMKAHDDFEDVAYAKDIPLVPNSVPDQWLLRSPAGAEMLYFFGQNKAELKRINALAPDDQLRELVKLEDKLSEPAANKVTRASKPPGEVGARQSGSHDALKNAVENDDQDAYTREANARDIARLKGGKR